MSTSVFGNSDCLWPIQSVSLSLVHSCAIPKSCCWTRLDATFHDIANQADACTGYICTRFQCGEGCARGSRPSGKGEDYHCHCAPTFYDPERGLHVSFSGFQAKSTCLTRHPSVTLSKTDASANPELMTSSPLVVETTTLTASFKRCTADMH
jgi:hypothetical protein